MLPLSCINCLHNPLQLGPIGTTFGFCTIHRVVLRAPESTTCGRQLRKDLLADSAAEVQEAHQERYPVGHVVLVTDPRISAADERLVEPPNGGLPDDPVVEEVLDYGELDSKVSSLAALRRVSGARAEVARLSLSRAYFSNCFKRDHRWTAGIHLLWWTLREAGNDPVLAASDLREEPANLSMEEFVDLAKWYIVALRLSLMADIGSAAGTREAVRQFAPLAEQAAASTKAGSGASLLQWIRRRRSVMQSAFPRERYQELRDALHRE